MKRIQSREKPDDMKEFLNEIKDICKKYNLSISHEDGHGAFIIEEYDEYNINWLEGAFWMVKIYFK